MAERYQTVHHEMILDPGMTSEVPQLVRHYGEQIMQPEFQRFLGLTAPIPHKDRMAIYTPAMRERFAHN